MHFFELGGTKNDKRAGGTAAIPHKRRNRPVEQFSYAALSRAASLGNIDQVKNLGIDPTVLRQLAPITRTSKDVQSLPSFQTPLHS